ncbi:MAG: molecular chaperone TorD family protein [Desulfobulbaceae bacterium]|nr:molecular chaperone TorD family protein [Desulfobulbaceae bacterium]
MIVSEGASSSAGDFFRRKINIKIMIKTSPTDHISTIYRFCAQSMHYPDPVWLTEDYFSSLFNLLDALGGIEEKELLSSTLKGSENYLEDLQVEYTRLFINGMPHVAAPPYGSIYLEKTLQGKYAEDLLLYYRSLGYTLSKKADFPDNLIHQLEFLSFLAEDSNQQAEEEFLLRFFHPWYPHFSKLVKEDSLHPFYLIIITIIDFFTKEEEEYGVQFNKA